MTQPGRSLADLLYAYLIRHSPLGIVDGSEQPVAGDGIDEGGGGSSIVYGNTLSDVGVQVAPAAANTTICALTDLPAGQYEIEVVAGYGPTAETATDFNQVLRVNDTIVGELLVSGASIRNTYRFKRTIALNDDLRVTTGAAGGSAGSVYLAAIYATRIGDGA